MASACVIISRQISTSSVCHGKRNFRKFLVLNKRGSRAFKEEQAKNPNSDIPIDRKHFLILPNGGQSTCVSTSETKGTNE